jgi:hypothetical protein
MVMKMKAGMDEIERDAIQAEGLDPALQLPRHLKPEDADDFVGVVLAAAKVGEQLKAIGEANDRLPARPPLRVLTRPGKGLSQEVRRSAS